MILAKPEVLNLLWALPVLAFLMAWNRRRTRQALDRLVGAKLAPVLTRSVSPARRAVRAVALVAFVAAAALALARPRWGVQLQEVRGRGVDVIVALDTSQSMDARDVAPSRMELAKLAVRDLAAGLAGNRVGLVAFAGSVHLLCPLTLDPGAVPLFLELATTGLATEPGTNIGLAITKARSLLSKEEGKGKAIVVITDGENLAGDPVEAAESAKADGITIFTVGVGSGKAEPIPVLDEKGEVVEYKKSESGEVVQSRLDETKLEGIATATGGKYFRLGAGRDVGPIRAEIAALPQKEMEARREESLTERYQIPLGVALLALVLDAGLGDFRRAKRAARANADAGRAAKAVAATVIAALLPLLVGFDLFGAGRAANEEGNGHYTAGKYEDALKAYTTGLAEDPERSELLYNTGNALDRLGKHEDAARAYDQAAGAKGRPDIEASVAFNKGNALLAAEKLKEAAESYVKALTLDPSHKGAKRNLEIALRSLNAKPPDSKSCPNPKPGDKGENKKGDGERKQEPQQAKEGEDETKPEQAEDRQAEEKQEEEEKAEEKKAAEAGEKKEQPKPPADETKPEEAIAKEEGKDGEKKDLTRDEAEQILKAMQAQEAQALREKAVREGHRTGGRLDW